MVSRQPAGVDAAVFEDWLAELSRRAVLLRAGLVSAGAGSALSQRLAPLARLTAPGRDEAPDEALVVDETVELLVFCLAHARWLSLRHPAVAWQGAGTLVRMPTTSPLLTAVVGSVLDALVEADASAYLDALADWLERPASRDALLLHGHGLADRYEEFLQHFDPQRRRAGGVYFTPDPVVAFMWARVEHALVDELGHPRGLADPDLSVLDPSVGAGAFPAALCDRMPDDASRLSLAGRLHGFEVMLASHAICHMRLAERLLAAGAPLPLPRVDVCLASALVEPDRAVLSADGDPLACAIAAEAEAAVELHRRGADIIVGNPPYRRSSDNRHPVIDQRMGPYKAPLVAEPNLQPLSDDYVKFFRRLEMMLEQRPAGVLALVTPSTYLSGRLHRGMRGSLLSSCGRVDLVDLHGSARGEQPQTAATTRDENVFGVGQGIAISVHRRGVGRGARYAELTGSRESKLAALARGELSWIGLQPEPPEHLLVPRASVAPEYPGFLALDELFDFHSVAGKPGDDATLVSFERGEAIGKLERARGQLGGVRLSEAMRKLARRPADQPFDPDRVQAYAYRPFDTRLVYDDPELWTRPVRELRRRVDGAPLLWVSRVVKDAAFAHVFVSRTLPDVIGLSPTSSVNCHVFPRSALQTDRVEDHLGIPVDGDGLFAYVYAILHSPGYRRRYAGPLRGDYPRLPLPRAAALFRELAVLGGRLLGLHLMEEDAEPAALPRFVDGGDRQVARVGERARQLLLTEPGLGRLHINDTSYFEPIPSGTWRHRIGGYQVCFKWLHDRRRAHRKLDDQEVEAFRRVVASISQTRRLMARVERTIRDAGGWPGAFER